jgi:hypothetical protein
MMDGILSLLALIIVLQIGFASLALSQDRNWRRVVVAPLPAQAGRTALRTVGSTLLGLGLPLALWRDGPAFGSLMWVMLLSMAAATVTLILSWRPRWLEPLARIGQF